MKHYSTLYVGMDVHRDSFTLAHFALDMKQPTGIVQTDNDYRRIVAYVHVSGRNMGRKRGSSADMRQDVWDTHCTIS